MRARLASSVDLSCASACAPGWSVSSAARSPSKQQKEGHVCAVLWQWKRQSDQWGFMRTRRCSITIFRAYVVTSNNEATLSQVNLISRSAAQNTDLRLSVPPREMQHFLCLCGTSLPFSDFGTSL